MPYVRRLVLSSLFTASSFLVALPAEAQPLGVFRWQLQPYCNILSLTVTQNGGIYTLDGTDDQCSGAQASVNGIAFVNPGGNIGFGLTVVTAPGGAPVHIDATITLPSLNGTWRDSSGQQGTFTFTTGAATNGSPRPIGGGIGSAAVNASQVQLRVAGTCPTGQAMVGVGQNGGVTCAPTGGGGGGITGVTAGAGLTGGGTSGTVSLAVNFAGPGAVGSAARSDHQHQKAGLDNTGVGGFTLGNLTTGARNTALGQAALFNVSSGNNNTSGGFQALNTVSSGSNNTAFGQRALLNLTTADRNTAVGSGALQSDTTGAANVAVGYNALQTHNGGNGNTAVGDSAMVNHPTGGLNTALGYGALASLTTGHVNLALGQAAGTNLTSGSNNVYVANEGVASEDNTIRLGSGLLGHTRLFLAATRGVTTGLNNGAFVLIDSNGQLGTVSSSRRTKEDIQDLGNVAFAVQRLRPVQFRYIKPYDDGTKPIQYGLIAEEVEDVMPELVVYGADGQVETVKYHVLPTLLLAEVQRLERERAAQQATLDQQTRTLDDQSRQIAELKAIVDALQKELTSLSGRR
jgi:hypothetical protein